MCGALRKCTRVSRICLPLGLSRAPIEELAVCSEFGRSRKSTQRPSSRAAFSHLIDRNANTTEYLFVYEYLPV